MTICIVEDLKSKKRVTVNPGEVLHLGRGESPDCLNLVMPYQEVSSHHAEIRWDGARWTIVDLGSANGTKLHGEAVLPNEPKQLYFGDWISIGFYKLRVACPSFAPPAVAEEPTRQQDLTGIRVSDHTILKLVLLRGADNKPLTEQQLSKNLSLFALIIDCSNVMSIEQATLSTHAAWGLIGHWNANVQFFFKPEKVITAAKRACRAALMIQKMVNQFNQENPVYQINCDITITTKPAAINILAPEVLLDGDKLSLIIEERKAADGNRLIVDELTYNAAADQASFQPIVEQSETESKPTGLYRLLAMNE